MSNWGSNPWAWSILRNCVVSSCSPLCLDSGVGNFSPARINCDLPQKIRPRSKRKILIPLSPSTVIKRIWYWQIWQVKRLQSNTIYLHKSIMLLFSQVLFFFFFVADNLGPQVVYCPPDQNITATKMRTVVTWKEPEFKDNSKSPLVIACNLQSGTEFYWGTWNVHCTAYDNNPDNEPAVCHFTLTVKRK